MKGKGQSIFVIGLLLISFPLFAGAQNPPRSIPLPIVEVEGVLSRWLSDSGFSVISTRLENGQVQLKVFRQNKSWQIILESHSPLATQIRLEYGSEGQPDQRKIEEMWAHLDAYSRGLPVDERRPDQEVPMAISARGSSVVCIKAQKGNQFIQFTGFFVDQKGLILSTAHDLSDVHEVTVALKKGQEVSGRLVRTDPHRDLTLIDIGMPSHFFIPLVGARTHVEAGEKVYAIVCPNKDQKRFEPGIIDGPPKRVNNLPVYQVVMETLPGSSGSPVLDADGYFIGIVKGRFRGTDSVGFLIPFGTVTEFLEKR